PYLIDSLGWAHKNDIQLVTNTSTTATKKVGDTVTVQSHAAQYQTGQNIPSWVKGKKYKIKQIKSVNQSKSKKAYLLDGINSWFLEQDVK
ncbi:N-acetylmuramoyl-L-alanine amidase, partial [Enterococcus gallinarum]|nr:N-acetylmuramoyl-L-alanine amidase [Enterococcus gallinarum]